MPGEQVGKQAAVQEAIQDEVVAGLLARIRGGMNAAMMEEVQVSFRELKLIVVYFIF